MSIEIGGAVGSSQNDVVLIAAEGTPIVVPDGFPLFEADFARDGRDLVLSNPEHGDLRVVDYFHGQHPADLFNPEGAVLRGPLAELLAGPEAPGQYAQAGGAVQGADPIGQVETVDGSASVQRTDGVVEQLNIGTKIFLNDVVQTGDSGKLSVTFVDGTIFTLSSGSRMIIDNLVYTPSGQNNSGTFNLIQGGFVFIAGQVARTGGMEVKTPAATMGIRGTTVLADIETINGVTTSEITLTEDPDGHVGRVAVFDLGGNLITTITDTTTKWIISTNEVETRQVERTDEDARADNVLIADVVEAYQSAVLRFQTGGSFIELNNLRGDPNAGRQGPDDGGVDLDSDDDQPVPELAPQDTPPSENSPNFDEGRNILEPEAERTIILTGFEDLDEDSTIAGKLNPDPDKEVLTLNTLPTNGTVTVGKDGVFTYVPNADFNGEDEFTYTLTKDEGVVEIGTVKITVLPVNDSPTITDSMVAGVEDSTLAGRAKAVDVDGDNLTYSLLSGAKHGDVALSENGNWVYTPAPDFAGTDRFRIGVADPSGETASQLVTVVVADTPDAPVVVSPGDAARGNVSEDGAGVAKGKLTAIDPDSGASLVWSGSALGVYGSFLITAEGRWTYVAGPAAQSLTEGQSVTERFRATVTDDTGESVSQVVRITLTGANDGPVVTNTRAEARGAAREGASEVSGHLTASDADAGAVLTWKGSAAGLYGDFTITGDGAWTYVTGPQSERLAAGQTVTERFRVTVTDDQGESARQFVTIKLTGENDGPVITSARADARGNASEGGPEVRGQLVASDTDSGAVLVWSGSADGRYGSFEIGENGAWSYAAGPGAAILADGQTVIERFVATVTDDQGATATQVVRIVVTGTNDRPVITSLPSDATGNAMENGPAVTGKLTASDVDHGAVLTWSGSAAGTFGSFVIGADGAWSYVAGPAAEALAKGQTVTEHFTATVTDDRGATATQLVTVTLTGENDGPVVTSGPENFGATENGPTVKGVLTASDVDSGAALTWTGSATGTYGAFSIAANGAWTYVAGAGSEALAQGEKVTESFTATVTDDHGATATQVVTITVTGANDAPVVTSGPTAAKGNAVENGPAVTGKLTASDVDHGAVLAWTGSAAGTYGAFVIAANGAWSYVTGPAAEALAQGQTVTESFTATVTDDRGATATQVVTITLIGKNDGPVAHDVDLETDQGASISGVFTATDVDTGAKLSFAAGADGPDHGAVSILPDGSYTYIPNPGFSGLDSFAYTVTDEFGAADMRTVTVAVNSLPYVGGGGQTVSLNVYPDPDTGPAGSIVAAASAIAAAPVNLVVTLDRSGSIGTEAWQQQLTAVADALDVLRAQFAGAVTDVDVQIISYAATAKVEGTFDLSDPALGTTIRSLPFSGGGTNWGHALVLAESFFDSQPAGETNFLYFITDGVVVGSWLSVLNRINDESTKGYTVNIEAFGIGSNVDINSLMLLDSTPHLLDGPSKLTDAFTETPLFSATLVDLSVTLIADGADLGEIANESAPGLITDGFQTTLALADIPGIAGLLGEHNRISVTAGFSLDGDPDTVEVTLFDSEIFSKRAEAQTLIGTDGSDLLFGSDLADNFSGKGGNDVLLGFGGDDLLRTGAGLDTVLAGAGNDRIVVDSWDAPSGGLRETIDGGAGRDVLAVEGAGNVGTGLLAMIDLSGVEAIDMDNGVANTLSLTLTDVMSISDEADSELEGLLARALPESLTIYGDGADSVTLVAGADGAFVATGETVVDGDGNSLAVFQYVGSSDVLATLAVDSDVSVTLAPTA